MKNEKITLHEYQEWLKKREKTFLAFCVLTCCLGTEYSVIIPSLWFYIEDIETQNTEMFYGITLSMYYVSALIGSLMITRYVDRTRNVKKTMLILILCEILGNILYSIPLSGYYLIIGRFIQGLGDVNMSIQTAEIARSYTPSELTARISTIVACFSTMFVIAPAFNIVFKYINFTIYGFHVYYGNLPGILMVIFFCIVLILAMFTVTDLSKEFDLKENLDLVNRFENKIEIEGDETSSTSSPLSESTSYRIHLVDLNEQLTAENEDDMWLEIKTHVGQQDFMQLENLETTNLLSQKEIKNYSSSQQTSSATSDTSLTKNILKSVDFIILILLGFFMSFSIVAFLDVSMPILASNYFSFTSQTTGILFFCTGLLFIVVLQAVKYLTKRFKEYYLLFVGLAIFVISVTILLMVTATEKRYKTLRLSLFCIYVLLLGTCSCVEQVLVRSLLCQIIPSSCQAFAEGVRRSVSSLACILATFLVPLIVTYIEYLSFSMIFIISICMVLLVKRKNTLCNPTVIL